MSKQQYSIEVKELTKHFKETKAVDGVSFKVNRGEVFGFLGPNGAGKTVSSADLLAKGPLVVSFYRGGW